MKILALFEKISKIKKPLDLVKLVLIELKNIIQFSDLTLFVVQPELISYCEMTKPDIDKISI